MCSSDLLGVGVVGPELLNGESKVPELLLREQCGCLGVELLGSGFAVVGRSSEVLAISDTSHAVLEQLGAKLVSLDGLQIVQGQFDTLFNEHEADIVRPDRIVFGHTDDNLSLDDLVDDLAVKLALA